MKKIGKRLLAALLVVSTLTTQLPQAAFSSETGKNEQGTAAESGGQDKEQGSQSLADQITDNQSSYYEVRFELPDEFAWATGEEFAAEVSAAEEAAKAQAEESADEEPETEESAAAAEEESREEAETSEEPEAFEEEEAESEELEESPEEETEEEPVLFYLPETTMVKEGTLVSTLPIPQLAGYVFLGWYFDSDLTHKASTEDVVDRNMTLYARFGTTAERDAEDGIDYTSAQDVEPDYEVGLASYGLDEEEIRALLSVNDFSMIDETPEYELIAQAPDLSRLIDDEEQRELAGNIIEAWTSGRPEEAMALAALASAFGAGDEQETAADG